jgi:REP element-mobilizing transposase RayT
MNNNISATPLAYFITFTCYGARIHGDERETVDYYHNGFLASKISVNKNLHDYRKKHMTSKSYIMGEKERQLCLLGLRDAGAVFDWRLYAAHVRTNHVHVIIAADNKPEFVMTQLKARASKRLNRAMYKRPPSKRWTRHGSTRYIWTDTSLLFAIQYVVLEQGRKMSCYVDPVFSDFCK